MSHDSSGNTCPTEGTGILYQTNEIKIKFKKKILAGFIMSPSRGVVGEATWSTCSAATLSKVT
jgi:hypothetical protein